MKTDTRLSTVFLAFAGCLLFAAAQYTFNRTTIAGYLKPGISHQELISKAQQKFLESPLASYDLVPRDSFSINEDLFRFGQQYLPGRRDILQKVTRFKIIWGKKIAVLDESEKHVGLELEYDSQGRLRVMKLTPPFLTDSTNLSSPEALLRAKSYLYRQQIDTAAVRLVDEDIQKDDGLVEHRFTFVSPSQVSDSLKNTYEVSLRGASIVGFQWNLDIDNEKFSFPESSEIILWIFTGIMLLIWVIVIIIMVVLFFKRMRHDEIEFKKAFWLGGITMIAAVVVTAVGTYPDWIAILLGGLLVGVFVGVGLVFVWAVSESFLRDFQPEKIALIDLFFRGKIRVKETGAAILRALALSGMTVFLIAAAVWATEKFHIGYIDIDNKALDVYRNDIFVLSRYAGNITTTMFMGVIFLGFLSAYLQSRVGSEYRRLLLLGILFNLGGLTVFMIQPAYLAFCLFLPLSLIWAYAVEKYDLVTVLLALYLGLTYMSLYPLGFIEDGYLSLAVIVGILFLLALLAGGIFLFYVKPELADFENYLPEYVSRIAERERLRKELEIARSIQFKFLPRQNPDFPGLEIASVCKPAMEVGGDYYDFIRQGDHRLSVIVGDVSGKGVSAAFYMTMTKGIIKTLSKWVNQPSKVLIELNEVFYANAPRNVFISILYGVFDMQHRTLNFARAGHNPLMVRKSRAGDPELLQPEGIAIGMDKGDLFSRIIKEQAIEIEKGDIFIFFTDGISEAKNTAGEEFGEQRLAELLQQQADLPAQAILESISQKVFEFAGKALQHDDFTMVVVKVLEN